MSEHESTGSLWYKYGRATGLIYQVYIIGSNGGCFISGGNRIWITEFKKYNANALMIFPILKYKYVPREYKMTIHSTVLILTYASENWAHVQKQDQESKLHSGERRM